MKNEIGLRAGGIWVRRRGEAFDGSAGLPRDEARLDLFTSSGLQGASLFDTLAVLWRRSGERSALAASLRTATRGPRLLGALIRRLRGF